MKELESIRKILEKLDEVDLNAENTLSNSKEVMSEYKKILELRANLTVDELNLLARYSENRIKLEESISNVSMSIDTSKDEVFERMKNYAKAYDETHNTLIEDMKDFSKSVKSYKSKVATSLLKKVSFACVFICGGFAISHFGLLTKFIE